MPTASQGFHPSVHAREHPDAAAIIMGSSGEVVTYAQLDERSNRFARLLAARGLRPGDRIAILMENNPRYLEVAWGAQRSGLYYTAINRHLRPGEVQYIVSDCGASVLVTSKGVGEVVGDLDLSGVVARLMVGGVAPGFESYEEEVAAQPPVPIATKLEGREALYSSGTTGQPEGVRKELPLTPLGDPGAAPVAVAAGVLI